MTSGALPGGEQLLAASGGTALETAFRRLRSGNRQLTWWASASIYARLRDDTTRFNCRAGITRDLSHRAARNHLYQCYSDRLIEFA
jgi:hypothetical protein